jgi:radical SAM superfamily enzyme YgiQ (UPF0313 family)
MKANKKDFKLLLILPKDITVNYEMFSENTGYITGLKKGSPPLSLATIAALTPKNFKIKIIDENVEKIKFDEDIDIVGITGNTYHLSRAAEIAQEFSKKGVTVICGGFSVSVCPERWRPFADVLIIGEAERIWPEFIKDYISGSYRAEYREEERFELSLSPIPDFSSIIKSSMSKYSYGVVQTSRGCSFSCEFCSVRIYAGSKVRYKPIENIIKEIDNLRKIHKYRFIFIVDDNFSADIKKAKEILKALIEWNRNQRKKVYFTTQLSIDAAKDEEFLVLAAEAGLIYLSIGLESPSVESLKEVKKYQNIVTDFSEAVRKIHQHGITIMANSMIGFDNDDISIFKKQRDFFSRLGVASISIYPLLAFDGTPLKERMIKEERYIEWNLTLFGNGQNFNMLGASNIVPKNMSVEQLHRGILILLKDFYIEENFIERLKVFFTDYERSEIRTRLNIFDTTIDFEAIGVIIRLGLFILFRASRSERNAFRQILKIASSSSHPQKFDILIFYFIRLLNYKNLVSLITNEKSGSESDQYMI